MLCVHARANDDYSSRPDIHGGSCAPYVRNAHTLLYPHMPHTVAALAIRPCMRLTCAPDVHSKRLSLACCLTVPWFIALSVLRTGAPHTLQQEPACLQAGKRRDIAHPLKCTHCAHARHPCVAWAQRRSASLHVRPRTLSPMHGPSTLSGTVEGEGARNTKVAKTLPLARPMFLHVIAVHCNAVHDMCCVSAECPLNAVFVGV